MSTIAAGKRANLISEIGVLKLKVVATVSSLKLKKIVSRPFEYFSLSRIVSGQAGLWV